MLAMGTILQGRYRVVRTLGVGGMGAVYLAQDMRLANRSVAVKEMIPDPSASPAEQAQAQQHFQGEASMLASLDHPNLPRVSDHFTEGGRHYLVMGYVDGETLEHILNRTSGFLPESQVLNWAIQLCDVLDYLHGQQPPVIFRDLKPSNVMLDQNDTIKLIDFGIARTYKVGKRKDTGAMGSENYAPPEQWGKEQTDARSDIYALGATIYHLLTGTPPLPVFVPGPLPPPHSLNPGISRNVEQAVLKAMARSPSERYQSTQEMKQALLGQVPSVPPSPKPTVPVSPLVPQPRLMQRIMPFLLVAAVGLLLGAVLVMSGTLNRFWQRAPTPTGIPVSPPLITASNVARLTELAQINQEVLDLAWSPDGWILALATTKGIALYETPTVTQKQFVTTTMPLAVAFSPDSRWLLIGSTDNAVSLWDVSSGGMLLRLEGHMAPVTDVAFGTTGQLVASSSKDDSVRVWDVAHEIEQYHLSGHSDWVLSIAFSPDGRWLASGSRDNSVRLWNMKDGTTAHVFQRHVEPVTTVAIAPDSRLLASGGEDSTVRLWDTEELAEVRVMVGHLAGVTGVVFNPDGRLLASGSRDGTVRLWDVETGVELRTLKGHTGEVMSVTFDSEGRWLASADNDGMVRLWGVR